jgi:hypothetical protein
VLNDLAICDAVSVDVPDGVRTAIASQGLPERVQLATQSARHRHEGDYQVALSDQEVDDVGCPFCLADLFRQRLEVGGPLLPVTWL